MKKEKLRQIIADQQELFKKKNELIDRDVSLERFMRGNEIIIISGIRRCGKSSLLKIIADKIKENSIYINFDDVRMTDFETGNFSDIEDIAGEIYGFETKIIYLLDEVQNIRLWEKWVNNLYSKDIKVFVTGSNSSLLSSEISTYLTGRNKILNLYPFSFMEFLKLIGLKPEYRTTKEKQQLIKAFNEYFEKGGFPLVLKNNDLELSKQYFEDIFYKDIISRYDIRKTKEYKDLVLYLFSNIGSTYSYSTLKQVSGIKSLSMIKNYIDYLKSVFLGFTINKFDYSIKKQKVSSSKFYAGDNSFLKTVAFNFSENTGHRLENLVFINLLRQKKEVYYYYNKGECDFVIKQGLKITEAIQVSLSLSNPRTKKREIEGLADAMNKYKLKQGTILTLEDEDEFDENGKKIIVKPVWKWLLEN